MRPILKLDEKEYSFKTYSIILFLIGAPLLSFFLILFFNLEINNWTREIIAKQTVFILNQFFGMETQTIFNNDEWILIIPRLEKNLIISLWCTSFHIISIFISVIIFIPHSQEYTSRKDINIRKTKALTILIAIVYIGNLIRLILFLYLTNIGFPWDSTHLFINYLTGFLAAILFILILYFWLPEIFISIYYIPSLISYKRKMKKKV